MAAVAAAQKNREMFAIKKSYSVENGYPSTRRSLVDDARFETLVVKQAKQSAIDEARIQFDDAIDIDMAIVPPSNELINNNPLNDFKTEEIVIPTPTADAGLTEEEVILNNAINENLESANTVQKAALILRLKEGMGSLTRILKSVEKLEGSIIHLETRPTLSPKDDCSQQLDVLVKLEMSRMNLLLLIKTLRQSLSLTEVNLLAEDNISVKNPWFPRHARDLDNCNHLMTKYEPDLDMNHPGFADQEYRARRKMIAQVAFNYKYGDPIPRIDYNETEVETWTSVFNMVLELMPQYACAEYRRVFKMLQDADIFVPERIPQLEQMSNFLRQQTGFSLRPAAGLLTARDFLASLAFRIFQSTQYVRHTETPFHTPEPDCIHELLGHMPLLADPSFAQFSQEIGLASLGASDKEIEKLSTVYWFTVEFGLCKEQGQVKAYGAGLLSAYGELLHAMSEKPELRPFEPATTAMQPYQDQEYQPIYYVAESFDDAKDKFRRWVSTMSRPFEVRFNPHTGTVEVLDSVDRLESLVHQLNTEVLHLSNAIIKLKSPEVYEF